MNTKTNEQILNDYYNCIQRKDIFIKILDRESEYWAVRRINQWKHNRNAELLKNTSLNGVNDWLINLNNQLAKLMNEVLSELKKVLDWKENKITIENGNLEFRLRESLKHLRELPIGIKMNYDADKILALEMQNYCLNGFDLMIDFITTGLLVDIEKLPSFYLIQEVITNIKNSIDFEKVKFIAENRKINIYKQTKSDAISSVPQLTIKQIALKLAYEKISVTRENADEIIKNFGHSSGHKLYMEFNKVWSSKKRIINPDISLKILQNKIKLFESVVEVLSPDLKSQAEDEIKILKAYLSNY